MKLTSILIFLFPLQLFATATNTTNEFSRAQQLWKDFRQCEIHVKKELALINCVEPLINSKIPRYEKGKLASMIIMGFSFSDLHSCDNVLDLLPLKPIPGEKYFCMHVLGNKARLPGYISVTVENERFKLNAIKYNDRM